MIKAQENEKTMWMAKVGSHLPLQKSFLKVFPVSGVLEIGAGIVSTPLFWEMLVRSVSIESDIEWIKKIRARLGESDLHKLVHHGIMDKSVNGKTRYHAISDDVKREALELYRKHVDQSLNYLFVDQWASLRAYSLIDLYLSFDFILYHDSEYFEGYGYHIFKPDLDLYLSGSYAPSGLPSTNFLIRKRHHHLVGSLEKELEIQHRLYVSGFPFLGNPKYRLKKKFE